VRIEGHDIRELDLPHLRSNVGVVMQHCFLFRGTVRENIAATKPDASLEEIVDAATMAGADEFIKVLPQGYDTFQSVRWPAAAPIDRPRLAASAADPGLG
jgi:ATP-binding cassette subfamily B protein